MTGDPASFGQDESSARVTPPDSSLRRYVIGGGAVIALLLGGLGGWAATSEIAGAVIAPGTIVVDSNVKKVQHPTGGIVGDLKVREGAKVSAGDVLITLDGTATRTNLQVIVKQLDELAIRQARLKAERDSAAALTVPASLAERMEQPDVAEIVEGEKMLFASRRAGRAAKESQLAERIQQTTQLIAGLEKQAVARENEAQIVMKDLEGLEQLAKTNLVQVSRVNLMRREASRLDGEAGKLRTDIAQAEGRISELKLAILQIDQDLRTETMRELRDAQAKEAELVERRTAAEDLLRRIDIRAPQSGFVHQLSVHTIGGVINSGETLMLIVPEGDRLVVEAKVYQQDIEQVHVGQEANLRFTAFNVRTTPELAGVVDRVAADLTRDQATGIGYFSIRVTISDGELEKLGEGRLMPGMPVDVQFRTRRRTALSYFVKPFSDQMSKAFRER